MDLTSAIKMNYVHASLRILRTEFVYDLLHACSLDMCCDAAKL